MNWNSLACKYVAAGGMCKILMNHQIIQQLSIFSPIKSFSVQKYGYQTFRLLKHNQHHRHEISVFVYIANVFPIYCFDNLIQALNSPNCLPAWKNLK